MTDAEKTREHEVFGQSLSMEDLDAASGGDWDADSKNCVINHYRDIYGGNGFPNCAATVEGGSHCWTNDACLIGAILYENLNDCHKAWR